MFVKFRIAISMYYLLYCVTGSSSFSLFYWGEMCRDLLLLASVIVTVA